MALPETDTRMTLARQPKPILLRAWDRALELVFPPRCVSCNAFGAFICDRCRADMIPAVGPRCEICWMPIEPHRPCRRCRYHRPAFDGARSAFVYEGAARDTVLALKFRGTSAVAPLMARSMAETLADWRPPADGIVPVPLSGQRRRLRGYNQSELLAKELSSIIGLPLERGTLTRRRHTLAQATLTGDARWQNVWKSFRAGKATPSGGVILIDDVITTGATLDACARVLLSSGAGAVFALTFARED